MYAPTLEKSSARHTKIGRAPRGDLTSLVQGRWRQADDFYDELAARGRRKRGRKWPVVWLLLHLFLCSASASELP